MPSGFSFPFSTSLSEISPSSDDDFSAFFSSVNFLGRRLSFGGGSSFFTGSLCSVNLRDPLLWPDI